MTDKPFSRAEMRAYNEAHDAYEAFLDGDEGAPTGENPFIPGTRKHEAWQYGWNEARDMLQRSCRQG